MRNEYLPSLLHFPHRENYLDVQDTFIAITYFNSLPSTLLVMYFYHVLSVLPSLVTAVLLPTYQNTMQLFDHYIFMPFLALANFSL